MASRPHIKLLSVGDEVIVYQFEPDGSIEVAAAQVSTIHKMCGDAVLIRYISYQGPRQWMLASFNNVENSALYRQGPSNDCGRPVYFLEV